MADDDQYRHVAFDAARCPGCGNEDDNTRLEPEEGANRDVLPPVGERAVCGGCGRSARPAVFSREYREERMTDDQREQAHEERSEWRTRSAHTHRES